MGVEADVHLIDGKLLVAHDRADVKRERSLESLYLNPMAERTKRHQGKIYPEGGTVTLLIDIKGPAAETWAALRDVLASYRGMLTEYNDGNVTERAVKVVLSGNRPVSELTKEKHRLAFIDGRPDDLETNPSAALVPLVSAAWPSLFAWRGDGAFPEDQRKQLGLLTAKAHAQGRRVRFWGTRDHEAVWEALLAGGVDVINVDDLPALRHYLTKTKRPTEIPR